MLLYITWDASPIITTIGSLELRWYGLMFAVGFTLGFWMVRRMFLAENAPEKWLDSLFFLLIAGTLLGARLGHVFFYQWDYYSQHPSEMLQIWRGGLASHGGVIGVLLALWLFSRFVSKKSFFWVSDKVAVPIALVGALIRFGNLMNSEIVGIPTDQPWGFHFVNAARASMADVPRHPVQLYEALGYLAIFVLLYFLYWRRKKHQQAGYLTGLWFALIFGTRFVWEFFKSDQGGNIQEALGSFTTGQWLSIPCVLFGLWLMWRAKEE
ncbi:MAG: prolipoprotein diacylglyceryl transferase [Bacteroidota bacterium]